MKQQITAAGGLVTNDQGQLLMIFRRGKWDLPKGKVDEGETVEAAAIREVEEETGLRNIVQGNKIGITYHEYEEKGIPILKATHWYAMQVSGPQRLVAQTEEDITETRWVSPQALWPLLQQSYSNIVEIVTKAGWIEQQPISTQ